MKESSLNIIHNIFLFSTKEESQFVTTWVNKLKQKCSFRVTYSTISNNNRHFGRKFLYNQLACVIFYFFIFFATPTALSMIQVDILTAPQVRQFQHEFEVVMIRDFHVMHKFYTTSERHDATKPERSARELVELSWERARMQQTDCYALLNIVIATFTSVNFLKYAVKPLTSSLRGEHTHVLQTSTTNFHSSGITVLKSI